MRDINAFRERFNHWRSTGELPYEAGLPKYASGKDDDLIESLIKYEGFLEHATDIGDGVQTIGSGLTNKKYTSKGTITRQENRRAVQSEIIERRNRLSKTFPHWNELPDSAKNALIHYDYNFPINKKSSPKLLKYAAARDWENTAKQMDAGVNMKGFSNGLRKRREYERSLFLQDLIPTENQRTSAQRRIIQNVPTAVEMVDASPKWNPVGYQVPSYGTDRPYYDPTTPEYLSRANASYQDGYSFVPSHNTMLKNAVDMLNANTQLYQPTFNITQ